MRILNGGVDIFFVISGFVMVLATTTKRDFRTFLVGRLARIAPLYWLATLLMFGILHGQGQAPVLSDLILSTLFIPYGDPAGDMQPVLQVGWTLSYEMAFYGTFAATLWLGRFRQFVMIIGIFTVLIALRPVLQHAGAAGIRFSSLTLIEFVFGMGLGLVANDLRRLPPITGGVILAVEAAGLIMLINFPLPRAVAFGIPAALIVAGSVILEPLVRKRRNDIAMALGSASYSIYLFHFPLLYLVPAPLTEVLPFWILVSLLTVITVVVGYVIHIGIERPLLSICRRANQPRAMQSASA